MQFEELAVDYLDSNITTDGMLELNSYFSDNPSLVSELENITLLDKTLESQNLVLRDNELVFLGDFGNELSSFIKNQPVNAGKQKDRKKPFLIYFFSILGIAGLITSYFAFFNKSEKHPQATHQVPKQVQVIKSVAANTDEPAIQTQTDKKQTKQIQQVAKAPVISQATTKETVYPKNELSGKITEQQTVKASELEISLRNQLTELQKSNDIYSIASTEKKLGILLTERNETVSEAKAMLTDALNKFISLNKTELQAETTGELGKLELKLGNKTIATQKIDECINMLRQLNSPKQKYWQKLKETRL